jgi:dihydroxyacetone kinase-like protein
LRFTTEQAIAWIKRANERIQENKAYLTELDQAIGDGDHGINLARGFKEAVTALDRGGLDDIGAVFNQTGMTLLAKVGGASGPLYGTAFMKMGGVLKGKREIAFPDLAQAIDAAVEGIGMRGKAQHGDKTMLDLWEPFAGFIRGCDNDVDIKAFRGMCEEELERIKQLQAKRGRASFLGNRSIGHHDPGAVSSYYLFDTLCAILSESGGHDGEDH